VQNFQEDSTAVISRTFSAESSGSLYIAIRADGWNADDGPNFALYSEQLL